MQQISWPGNLDLNIFVYLISALIAWLSKKQATIETSVFGAECGHEDKNGDLERIDVQVSHNDGCSSGKPTFD